MATNAEENLYAVTETITALYDIKTELTPALSDVTIDYIYKAIAHAEIDYIRWDNEVKSFNAKIELEYQRNETILEKVEARNVRDISYYDDLAFCYIDDRVYKFSFVKNSNDLLSYLALT
jgi:hypothetical protein